MHITEAPVVVVIVVLISHTATDIEISCLQPRVVSNRRRLAPADGNLLQASPSTILKAGRIIRYSTDQIIRARHAAEPPSGIKAVVDGHVGGIGNFLQLSCQIVIIAERKATDAVKATRFTDQLRKLIVAVGLAAKAVSH